MVKESNFFRGESVDFSFELNEENVLDEGLNEKFEETVEEDRKTFSIVFARAAFFELTL